MYDTFISNYTLESPEIIENFVSSDKRIIKQGANAKSEWSKFSFNDFNNLISKGYRLPTVNEVRRIIDQNIIKETHDTWVPAWNNNKPDWVQVSDYRKKTSHLEKYGYPSWGNNNRNEEYRGKVLIYFKLDDYNIVIGNHPENTRSYSSRWKNKAWFAQSTLNSRTCWVMTSKDISRRDGWMIIDMGKQKNIAGVIIRNRHDVPLQYVTKLDVYVSVNKQGPWIKKIDNGQGVKIIDEPTRILFTKQIEARYVKLVPKKWNRYPSIRVDVLIYTKNNDIENKKIVRSQIIKKKELIHNINEIKLNSQKEGKALNTKFSDMGDNLKEMKENAGNYENELKQYKQKSINWKLKNIDYQYNTLKKDKAIKNNYFDTLYNFHNDLSRDIVIDEESINIHQQLLHRRENEIENNTQDIIDLENNLDTYKRQNNILIDGELNKQNNLTFYGLLSFILIIILILSILKIKNKITNEKFTYIIFIIIMLFIGFTVIKWDNLKNRSAYNYQNKIFKSEKELSPDDS